MPATAIRPIAAPFSVADESVLSSSSSNVDSADDFYVIVTGEEAVTDAPTTRSPTLIYELHPLPITDGDATTIKRFTQYMKLECGPMPNVMATLPNKSGALCSTPQSLADAHY